MTGENTECNDEMNKREPRPMPLNLPSWVTAKHALRIEFRICLYFNNIDTVSSRTIYDDCHSWLEACESAEQFMCVLPCPRTQWIDWEVFEANVPFGKLPEASILGSFLFSHDPFPVERLNRIKPTHLCKLG